MTNDTSTADRNGLRTELEALADNYQLSTDSIARATLEVLAADALRARQDVGLEEALDLLARELDINLLLADQQHEALRAQLDRRVQEWIPREIRAIPERLLAASDVLSISGAAGQAVYEDWLDQAFGLLADGAHPLLFVDFGASPLPAWTLSALSGMVEQTPEFLLLEESAERVAQARLLMALRELPLSQVAESIHLAPSTAGGEELFADLEIDTFGGIYLNLLGFLGRPRLRNQLTSELPALLGERLAAEGHTMLLAPPSLLTGSGWREFRRLVATKLHLEAVLAPRELRWPGASVRPAIVVLRRPWQPLTQRVTLFAPAADDTGPRPISEVVSETASWLRGHSRPQRDRPEEPPDGFFIRPTAELGERWDPKFNSPARRQLQEELIGTENVMWLSAVTELIAQGPVPTHLRPFIRTRLAGVSYEGRQETIAGLRIGDHVWLRRQPDNPYDPNAVHVERRTGASLGYLPADLAAELAPALDRNDDELYPATVTRLQGGDEGNLQGVTIQFAPPPYQGNGEEVTVVRPQDIVNNRLTGKGEPAWLLAESGDKVQRLQSNDILFNLREFSACAVPATFEGALCHHWLAIIRPGKDVDPLYLLSYILGSEFQQQLEFVMRDDGWSLVDVDDLRELLVVVPRLEDQRRIAWAFAESQGQLGPGQDEGVRESLRLAQDGATEGGHWLASTLLSNLFSDWYLINSLDDWLRLKSDYVRQLRNVLSQGAISFDDDALNRAVAALDDLRQGMERAYRERALSGSTLAQLEEGLGEMERQAAAVENDFVRRQFARLAGVLSDLLQTEPVSLPVDFRLQPPTVPAGRPALLGLHVDNLSGRSLHELEIVPQFSSGEVIEQPVWYLSQLPAGAEHIFEARLRFTIAGVVRIQGQIHYEEDGREHRRSLPPLQLEAVPPEQMPFTPIQPNPYITGGAVETPEMFFGRQDVMGFLRDSLIGAYQNNVIILQGNRRTGKSSILKQIVVRDWFAPHIPVYVDCQGLGHLTNHLFFYKLAREIWKALRTRDDVVEPRPVRRDDISEEDPFYDFRELLEDLIPPERHLILLIDEFEIIDLAIRDGDLDGIVLENLRHLLQHQGNMAAILTGSYRLSRLREEYWSVLFGIGLKHNIGFLDEESARQLITEPLQDQVEYGPSAVERIIRLTACQPLFVQMMCHNIVNLLNKQKTSYVTVRIVDEAAQETLVSASDQMQYMFQSAPSPAARAILVFMAQELKKAGDRLPLHTIEVFVDKHRLPLEESALAAMLREMSERGVVRIDGPAGRRQYGLKIDLFRQWLRSHEDISVAVARARESSYLPEE